MIKIYYSQLNSALPTQRLEVYLRRLPSSLQFKIQRYRKTKDVQRVLFGKLLLQNGLEELSDTPIELDQLECSKTGKPYLKDAPDFNLSYSGDYVLCAINTQGRIGIDIEQIRPIDLNDYSFLFHGEVFRSIRQATDPAGAFFENWTIREAILKAEGTASTDEVKNIEIKEGKARFKNRDWFYQPLPVAPGYLAYMATDVPPRNVLIEATTFCCVL